MKTIETIQEAELVTSLNGKPFVITGPIESVTELYEAAQTDFNAHPVQRTTMGTKVAQTALEHATEQYLNLGNLDSRTEARLSLKALAWDIKTFGRNNEYHRFKERVAAEKALAMDMELGLIQSVHCRLHERMLNK